MVLGIVDVAVAAIASEIAIGVIGEARRAGGGILIETVGRIVAVGGADLTGGKDVDSVVARLAGDLRGGVVANL
jgi:hypothetical protein